MIAKLAWKNLWFKPLNTVLSIVLLASSVAIITVLILLQKQFEEKFSSNIDGVDLVLGAQGSPMQLILSSVYHIDNPTGNISYDSAKVWMKHPFVEKAIPLAFGDNYLGYKILGTNSDYLDKYQAKISEGKLFSKNFEVVVGSEIAKKLNFKIGAKFNGSHGSAKEGEKHEEFNYIVTGIVSPTGKVIDNLILCNIPSVWQMHEIHEDESHQEMNIDEPNMEITAVLLKFRNKMGIVTWPRIIAQNTKMQAASPAIEVNRIFSLFGVGLKVLEYLAYAIMLISGISIFIALYNRLKERKYEFALMRINGASRFQLLFLLVIESLFLVIVGFLFGTIFGRIAISFISSSAQDDFKMAFNPFEIVWDKEVILFLVTIFVGVIAALIPAIKAYRLNISKTLANA
jgi:putative ABC transport system permease protein